MSWAELAGGAILAVAAIAGYSYATSSQNAPSSPAATNLQQGNPSAPPYLYDPIVDLIPKPTDVARVNSIPASTSTGESTTSNTGLVNNSISNIVSQNQNVISNSIASQGQLQQNVVNATAQSLTNQITAMHPQDAATFANEAINQVIQKVGSITSQQYNQLAYSSGLKGYATVPITNSLGQITGSVVYNNATGTGRTANTITTTGGTSISTSSIVSSPSNALLGSEQIPTTHTTAPVYSQGSQYMGAGEYVNNSGSTSYISSPAEYQQQAAIGNIGTSNITSPVSYQTVSFPSVSVSPIADVVKATGTIASSQPSSSASSASYSSSTSPTTSTTSTTTSSTTSTTVPTTTATTTVKPLNSYSQANYTVAPTTTVLPIQQAASQQKAKVPTTQPQNITSVVATKTASNLPFSWFTQTNQTISNSLSNMSKNFTSFFG